MNRLEAYRLFFEGGKVYPTKKGIEAQIKAEKEKFNQDFKKWSNEVKNILHYLDFVNDDKELERSLFLDGKNSKKSSEIILLYNTKSYTFGKSNL